MKSPTADGTDGPCGLHGGIGATFFTAPSRRAHGAFAGDVHLSSPAHTAVRLVDHSLHTLLSLCCASSPTP